MERRELNPSPWPELNRLLADPSVTDICLNGAERLFVERGHGLQEETRPLHGLTEDALKAWALELLSRNGRAYDARNPFADARLAESGHRVHLCFPPISRAGLLVSLRRLPRPPADPETARRDARQRWSASAAFPALVEAFARGDSVLLSGQTGCGKTTLLNDLLAFCPPQERLVALEDTPELAPAHPHFLSLLSRPANSDGFGEVTLRQLLRQALRMRPDRILLGECRGEEFLDLLQAMNTGHRGACATLHATSPRDALRRAELVCLLSAGGALSHTALRELLAGGVQWVAQLEREPRSGLRRISSLCRVEGKEGDAILLRPWLCPPPD